MAQKQSLAHHPVTHFCSQLVCGQVCADRVYWGIVTCDCYRESGTHKHSRLLQASDDMAIRDPYTSTPDHSQHIPAC